LREFIFKTKPLIMKMLRLIPALLVAGVMFSCENQLKEVSRDLDEQKRILELDDNGRILTECDTENPIEATETLNAMYANNVIGRCYYASNTYNLDYFADENKVYQIEGQGCIDIDAVNRQARMLAYSYLNAGQETIHKLEFHWDLVAGLDENGQDISYWFISLKKIKAKGFTVCADDGGGDDDHEEV